MPNILQPNSAKLQIVNTVIDSLDLRVSRFASPSPWLIQQLPAWRDYHQNSEPGSPPFIIELPGLGSFQLHPRRSRRYEFVLINPEIGDIRIWNPDKWPTAIAGQTGQFYISFRSKFLQFEGTPGVRAFVQALEALFCLPWPDAVPGWERVSRADLTADMQLPRGYEWTDLDRFVTRARWKDINTDSISILEQIKEVLSSPPSDNRGGSTYNVSADLLQKAAQALESGGFEEGNFTRVIAKREVQTLYFGKMSNPLYARIYDKRASLKVQDKEYMEDVWKAAGWDGESPVWRHEFSMSGDFLRALVNLETGEIEDVRELELFLVTIPRIWQYLTCDWLRFTEPTPGDSNLWRSPVADSWAVLQMAFASPLSIVRARPVRQPQEDQLKAQLLGVALTLAAKRARSDTDPYAFESIAADFFGWVDSPTFYADLADRRRLLGLDDYTDTALSAFYRVERMAEGRGS